ncbi:MAG: formyl transferase [Magnetococcales bacterium]|nr:formyl transferase [Magnetococcales bacterium]
MGAGRPDGTLRVVFIGCVQSSRVALTTLLAIPEVEVVGVITRGGSDFNADFDSLADLAGEGSGISLFMADEEPRNEMAGWIRDLHPDIVYCIGWSWLLPGEILAIPPKGVVGYHPAALPQNRGRHPIIWALALGLDETASSFFLMDEGADSGDIISQERVTIDHDEDAGTLYAKLMALLPNQITTFTHQLISGNLTPQPQDHSQANHWRKRSPADGEIDWRMPAQGIYNLVRALTRPYPGATCQWRGQTIQVWQVAVVAEAPVNIEPGKVLAREGETVTVKCGVGAIRILEHTFPEIPDRGEDLTCRSF